MTKGNKMSSARETVYDRCAYIGCYNGKFINGRRLFHFPSETDRRLEMWIERSGNFRLRTWAATSLRKAGLCGDHFDDKCFTNSTRKALRRNVVPRHYTEDGTVERDKGNDSLNCERLSSTLGGSTAAVGVESNGVTDGTSAVRSPESPDDPGGGRRSPSPIVEFIVEELDESLIYEPSVGDNSDSVIEYEEKKKVQVEQVEESCDDSSTSPMRPEEPRESAVELEETSGNDTRPERSYSDVQTYRRGSTKLLESRANNTGWQRKHHGKTLLTLQDENKHLRRTVRMLKQTLRRAKARQTNYAKARESLKNVDEFLNLQECGNPAARAMVKLALHKRGTPYTKEEKDFAIKLYRRTSAAFVGLRGVGCHFPGQSTIKRWIIEGNGEPSSDAFTAAETVDNHREKVQVQEQLEGMMPEEMEEAVEDAEDAIDELVERLEEQIEDAQGHEVFAEELPHDEDVQVDFK